MEHANVDMAWNDFVQYRDSKQIAPKNTAWNLSKISLSIIALLLLSVGVFSGYQLAVLNRVMTIESASLYSESLIVSRKSTINQYDVVALKASPKADLSRSFFADNTSLKSQHSQVVAIPQANIILPNVNKEIVDEKGNNLSNSPDVSVLQNDSTITASINPPSLSSADILSMDVSSVEVAVVNNISMPNSANQSVAVKEEKQIIDPNNGVVSVEGAPRQNVEIKTTNLPNNTSSYTPSVYSETGNVRKGRRMNTKAYLSVFKRYTDISFYSLENSNDLSSEIHSRFTQNPANSGIDNRYSISAGSKSDFIQQKGQILNMQNRDSYIGNSFTLLNNNIGVGLAVQNTSFPNVNGLNFYLSSAYKITLAKNSQLRFGVGLSSSSVSIVSLDAPKSDLSVFSFHLGARYMYKTLYAQLSVNNFAPIMARSDISNNYKILTNAQMSFGGRLYLSKSWAIHPQLSIMASDDIKIGMLSSLSYQNKWLFGLQTNDFNSLGMHAGMYLNKRFSAILKSDFRYSTQSSSSLMESGELMLKIELGRFKR